MYITGTPATAETTNRTDLGFPIASTYEMTVVAPNVSNLELRNIAGGMPIGAFVVGDIFRPDSGVSNGFLYEILGIVADTATSKTYNVGGLLEGNIAPNPNTTIDSSNLNGRVDFKIEYVNKPTEYSLVNIYQTSLTKGWYFLFNCHINNLITLP